MIKIEGLSKKFGENTVIKNINFEAGKKEIISIVGPSGSGKSTLIRCINRLEEPNTGSVHIEGDKLDRRSIKKIRKKIGMVFQHFNLFPHMNVLENLIYAPTHVLKMKKKEAQIKAKDLLKRFSLSNKANAMPSSLSGGQKQRIAIIRAIMMEPEIILFDEPTSALDPEIIGDVVKEIKALKKNMTIIVVTHHLRFAKDISDRIIFMDQGQILCDQKKSEFFKNPKSHRARLFLEKVGDY